MSEPHGPRTGRDPADRGRVAGLALDLELLRPHESMQPLVEHLLAIQRLRGETSSLLFVRTQDIDRLAGQDGRPLDVFLAELQQLGVAVSPN